MDFNKEEAARARNIAEEKLWNNDFGTARRIALRAKKLDSQLENLNHILSVCDVHCAAENKINGKEMDWYGILQLEKTGDESLIKKQYRKLALLLHPDKNQYPGAEAAFKLIGEAQKVLLDRPKHQLHDSIRANSASATAHPACRQAEKPCTDKNPQVPNNRTNPFATKHVKKNPPPCQQHAKLKTNTKSGRRISFWTECTVCSYKNDFIVGKLGVPFMCQSCNKTFIPRSMSIGTKSCSEPTTPDMLKYADPATWYEKFGLDEMKIKGIRKRKAGACKSSGKDAKKQCKTSNKSSSQAEAKYC